MADAGAGLGPLAVGLLATAGPIAGAVIGAVVAYFTRRDERAHEDRRRAEERENEARIRAEDRAADLERARLDHETTAAAQQREAEAADRQRVADACRAFIVQAHTCLQVLRRGDQEVSAEQWERLGATHGDAVASLSTSMGFTATFAVGDVEEAARQAAGTSDRQSKVQQAESALRDLAEEVQGLGRSTP